jgi:hypothetical protein
MRMPETLYGQVVDDVHRGLHLQSDVSKDELSASVALLKGQSSTFFKDFVVAPVMTVSGLWNWTGTFHEVVGW